MGDFPQRGRLGEEETEAPGVGRVLRSRRAVSATGGLAGREGAAAQPILPGAPAAVRTSPRRPRS